MREYETTIIVQPEISDEGSQELLARLDGILEAQGATRLMCEDLGKRKLAYEIRKFHKGHYFILSYLDEGKAIPELERLMRMDESILRFMTVQENDAVADVEARCAEAREAELAQQKRAEERAEREAEEAKARAEADAAALAAAEAAVAEEESAAEASEESPEAAAEEAAEEAVEDASAEIEDASEETSSTEEASSTEETAAPEEPETPEAEDEGERQ